MVYMGSKRRIAKYILPIMLSYRKEGQTWVGPFVGGGNMIDKVKGNRIGADINKWVIEALITIRDNVDILPKNNKEFTEEDYKNLRNNDDCPFKGFAGFAYSFGGKWMNGYRRGENRDFVKEAHTNAKKQSLLLQEVKFVNCSYDSLTIPKNSIIYCDPPYQNTTGYKINFDHTKFWQWVREKHKEGHTIFISEYNAPEDFEVLYEIDLLNTVCKKQGKYEVAKEKLFAPKGQKRVDTIFDIVS